MVVCALPMASPLTLIMVILAPLVLAEECLLTTARLAGRWTQTNRSANRVLTIAANGTFASEGTWQVGSASDPAVPFPTHCHYEEVGSVDALGAASDAMRASHRERG